MLRSKAAEQQLKLDEAVKLLRGNGYQVIPPELPPEYYVDNSFAPVELAQRWSCCTRTVYRLINEGKLKAFRVGTCLRVPYKEVLSYESGQPSLS